MMRVLVVEDDASVAAVIRMMLGRGGYDTVIAPDADAGMREFESFQFDLAIVDIFIPGVSGLTAIARFRAQAPALPILAISGFKFRSPGMDFLGMATAAGAGTRLQKPFTPSQLMTAVYASLNPSPPVVHIRDRIQEKGTHDGA